MRVCEEKLKSLATRSRNWRVAKGGIGVKHAEELKGHANWSTIGQNFQTGQTVSSRLKLVTHSSHELESPEHFVCYKIDSSHSIHTLLYIDLYTHEMLRASRENFEREPLEKNKIDSSTIFIL